MAKYNYSTTATENMAKAVLKSAPISSKHSIEICNMIRGKKVQSVKDQLQEVTELKKAVPFKRFNADVGHKPGMGPGRYPVKAAKMIKEIIESAEANAQFKGLNKDDLVIKHISAQKASRPMRGGRNRGRLGKRTNIEVVLEEITTKKTPSTKKDVKTPKVKEAKPVVSTKTGVKETLKTEVTAKTTPEVSTNNNVKAETKVEAKSETKVEEKVEAKVEEKENVSKKEDDQK